MENTTEICPICLSNVDQPVNFCSDESHGRSCRECICSYIDSTVSSAFLGTCPIIACPSTTHQISKKRRILRFEEWKKVVPVEMSKKYADLASSLLAFLCGGCHSLKSLDVGYESDQSAACYTFLAKYLTDRDGICSIEDLRKEILSYSSGLLNVEEFYELLIKNYFLNLVALPDIEAWEICQNLLRTVADPERRANLHLRYLRDHPRIHTICCNREHCFRCKVKDYHEGRSCMESTSSLDHSVVCCPTCGISLAKGDGCNTVTCVCGKQFSWSVEKENTDRCQSFLQSYPENTSTHCAQLLCTDKAPQHMVPLAKAWQIRNRLEVSRALYNWFKSTYWPCPSQCCVVLPLTTMPEGVREAADLWKSTHLKDVEKCIQQRKCASNAIFPSLSLQSERAITAYHLVNGTGVGLIHRNNSSSGNSNNTTFLLQRSAADWIDAHRSEYVKGIEEFELRAAHQFLYLYGNKQLHTHCPQYASCLFSSEWCRTSSEASLTYTNNNSTVERVGSVSCYPAAFSNLVADRAMFRVTIDAAPRTSNWLTFGIARKGMASSSSDGVGRTSNSWGLADDRSSSSLPVLAASGTTVGSFRKLKAGDILGAIIDTGAGWCEISLNGDECSHRFDITPGTREDYCFAMTFANDHRVTILSDGHLGCITATPSNNTSTGESSSSASTSTVIKRKIGCDMNVEQTQMYNSFKKHIQLLLADDELMSLRCYRTSNGHNNTNNTKESALKTDPQSWVDLFGSTVDASNHYEMIRDELQALVSSGKEFPWSDDKHCTLPWMTWKNVLDAASWYHDNRIMLREARDAELAYAFYLTHGEDAPFIAAVNLADFHNHKVEQDELLASLAFMHFYPEDMHEWYDYDAKAKEPVLESVAKGCRCLPRHCKICPKTHAA